MSRNLKIGYLTAQNVKDRRSWSGTHYRMYKALEKEFPGILALGPIKISNFLEKTLYLISVLHLRLFSRRYNKLHNILRSKYYAGKVQKRLNEEKFDILFAPAAATEIAYLNTTIPICYLSDTSFGQLSHYYESFGQFSTLSQNESNYIERKALKKSAHFVYSSSWAAKYVVDNYSVDPNSISIVPFGANIEEMPLKNNLTKDYSGRIEILFTAKHWTRKGGEIVLKTFEVLIKDGANVGLTILGCTPPVSLNDPRIKIIPFLNKNIPEEEQEFLKIFRDSHLFFLPTRADCTPVVLCEANAYGMPAITTDTGGVSSIIEDGINGYALPIDAKPDDYAEQILNLIHDPEKLKEMSVKSREKFEQELNWNTWASRMKKILFNVAGSDIQLQERHEK